MALLKCPHCGGNAEPRVNYGTDETAYIFIRCRTCGAQTRPYSCNTENESSKNHAAEDAANAWNMRTETE